MTAQSPTYPTGEAAPQGGPWRVGRHYPIHVYEGDRPVATFFTAADAKRAVDAITAAPQPGAGPQGEVCGTCEGSRRVEEQAGFHGWRVTDCPNCPDCAPASPAVEPTAIMEELKRELGASTSVEVFRKALALAKAAVEPTGSADEAVERVARAIAQEMFAGPVRWEELDSFEKQACLNAARAAIAAAPAPAAGAVERILMDARDACWRGTISLHRGAMDGRIRCVEEGVRFAYRALTRRQGDATSAEEAGT